MEALLDNLVGALGLRNSYTIVVLNPRWSATQPSHAYRVGFSDPELKLLVAQVRYNV
jgi:hypothetical protein